jgi:hypothetical protein
MGGIKPRNGWEMARRGRESWLKAIRVRGIYSDIAGYRGIKVDIGYRGIKPD